MALAEEIRRFVGERYFEPARHRGEREIELRGGDVHDEFRDATGRDWHGGNHRQPDICHVLKDNSGILQREYNVRLTNFAGPPSGMGRKTFYTYEVLYE